jgi:cytochrome c biogenesis factor
VWKGLKPTHYRLFIVQPNDKVAACLRVIAVLVIIWLIVGIAAGAWYFWPALGWGVALVARVGIVARSGVR